MAVDYLIDPCEEQKELDLFELELRQRQKAMSKQQRRPAPVSQQVIKKSNEAFLRTGKPGSKRRIRFENTIYLTDRVNQIEDKDWHLMTPTSSAFRKLLESECSLKIWNHLLHTTEEEQKAILRYLNSRKNQMNKERAQTSGAERAVKPREIKQHDAARARFLNIDRKLRRALKTTNVPEAALCQMEEELLGTFSSNNAEATLTWNLPSSYFRLISHALCQYYGLHSTSLGEGESRSTTIHNARMNFRCPGMRLSQLLQTQ
eukprot:Colp12_sorted_trinity150504_noHs@33191